MARFYDALTPDLTAFIESQRLFFTATAAPEGRINVSPKGSDTLRILSERQVAYLDLTGSGAETGAHVRHDGRLTLMFCSFADQPLILRLYGRGDVVAWNTPEWVRLRPRFPDLPGARQIIRLSITSVQTSCGYAVPLFAYEGERPTYDRWAEKKGAAGLAAYQREKNLRTVDGLDTGLVVPEPDDTPDLPLLSG